jgi:hypothetical protein
LNHRELGRVADEVIKGMGDNIDYWDDFVYEGDFQL